MSYAVRVRPWTQEVQIRWTTDLSFFEGRLSFLRYLQDAGITNEFRWHEHGFDVRIGDYETISIDVRGAKLSLRSPRRSPDLLLETLRTALERFSPTEVGVSWIKFQYVIAVDQVAGELQRSSGRVLMPEFGEQTTDWAILVDGESKRVNSAFQVEYGIIGPGEAEPRLNREIGRTGGHYSDAIAETRDLVLSRQAPMPSLVDTAGMPGCGLFLDWYWHLARKLPNDGFGTVVAELLGEAEEESLRNSLGILKRLGFDPVDSELAEAE